MNEPIGRFGSCSRRGNGAPRSPLRARFGLADDRLPRLSSIFNSFSFSPSSILSTGTPVQRDNHLRDVVWR